MALALAALAARQPTVAAISATAVSSSAISIALVTPSVEPITGIAFYILYRSASGGPFVPVQDISPSAFPYTDPNLQPSTAYTYFVEAVNNSPNKDTSDASAMVSATTSGSSVPTPSTPGITATTLTSASISIALTTPSTEPVNGIKNYVLLRSVGGSGFNPLATLLPSQWPYSDTGLSASTSYSYQTYAVDNDAAQTPSANSATTSATTQGSGPATTLGIKVSNGKFISSVNGSTISLIGAAILSLEETQSNGSRWAGPGGLTSAQLLTAINNSYNTLSSAGKPYGLVNMIRIPLCSSPWMGYQGVLPIPGYTSNFTSVGGGLYQSGTPTIYRNFVTNLVTQCINAGLYVTLDLHWGTPVLQSTGQYVLGMGQPSMLSTADLAFWTSIAQTFGTQSGFLNAQAIMFELFNEPYYDNYYAHAVAAAGCTFLGGGTGYLGGTDGSGFGPNGTNASNAVYVENGFQMLDNFNVGQPTFNDPTPIVGGMQKSDSVGHNPVIAAIRATGARNVVVASPPWYAGEVQCWPQMGVTDSAGQLAMSFHGYGYNGGFQNFLNVQATGVAILCTELGSLSNIPSSYVQFRANGMGYTWLGWANYGSATSAQMAATMASTTPWTGNGQVAPTGSN
jgi:hypothetical protein